jgi:hypothetical protein
MPIVMDTSPVSCRPTASRTDAAKEFTAGKVAIYRMAIIFNPPVPIDFLFEVLGYIGIWVDGAPSLKKCGTIDPR